MRRVLVVFLFVLAAVVGMTDIAVGLSPEAAPAEPPDGYHTVAIKKAGFSMAIPDTWLVIDATSSGYQEQLKKAAEVNPELAPLLEELDPADTKLFAADQTNPEFSNNVQVISGSDFGKSVISQPKAVKASLEAVGGLENVEVHKTRVAGRPALEATAIINVNLPPDGTPTPVHSTMYVVPVKKDVLQIVFSTTEDGRQDPTVQTMIDSFKRVR